jgi:sugar phosphate permease
MNGVFGFKEWQWLFLTEGLLAVVVGVVAYRYLDDAPGEAHWLSDEERSKLTAVVVEEERYKAIHGPNGVHAALTDRRVYFLAVIYFLIQMSVYGVVFYLPAIVARLLHARIGWRVGLVSAIPWICALAATYILPRLAERSRSDVISALTLVICAGGLALSATSESPAVVLVALCVVAAGVIAVQPLFWSFPTGYLGGAAAAGGIALINSLGVLGGFVAPNVKHWAEQTLALTGAGLLLLAGTTATGGMLFLWLRVALSFKIRNRGLQ